MGQSDVEVEMDLVNPFGFRKSKMTIDELSAEVYEDLNGKVVSVSHRDDTTTVVYECDDWENPVGRVSFRLHCTAVAETTVTRGWSEGLVWTADHPLLLNHNQEHGDLFFSSRPSNPHEVLGLLYQAHENLFGGWRPLRNHINRCGKTDEILAGGHGLLASGPLPLLEIYRESLGQLLTTKVVKTHAPDGGYHALVFDETFVICKEVGVTRADP